MRNVMRNLPYLGPFLAIVGTLSPSPSAADPITLRYEVTVATRQDLRAGVATEIEAQTFVTSVTFDDAVTRRLEDGLSMTAYFDSQIPTFSGYRISQVRETPTAPYSAMSSSTGTWATA